MSSYQPRRHFEGPFRILRLAGGLRCPAAQLQDGNLGPKRNKIRRVDRRPCIPEKSRSRFMELPKSRRGIRWSLPRARAQDHRRRRRTAAFLAKGVTGHRGRSGGQTEHGSSVAIDGDFIAHSIHRRPSSIYVMTMSREFVMTIPLYV